MDQAIETIVETFQKYADCDGKLSKEKMGKLIEDEFCDTEVKAKITSDKLEKILSRCNKDKDDELCFQEYMRAVVCMAKCRYRKKTGKCVKGVKG